MKQPTALVILDGFGISSKSTYNAIFYAHMPHFNSWRSLYPYAILQASGKAVGLPDGFQGNSEVGHITIGAGRIIPQLMTKWHNSIKDGSFFHNNVLCNQLNILISKQSTLHIISLLSHAGVHAHTEQLYACINVAITSGIKKIMIHAILDGRDSLAQSAYNYLTDLQEFLVQFNHYVSIGSLHGRFYAMDRDNNWQRTEQSYRVLTEQQNTTDESWKKCLEKNYAHSITDEFITPTQLYPDATIKNGDGIIFCNIRSDRARQLTASFAQPHFNHFITKPLNLSFFITPIQYDATFITTALFEQQPIINTLKDVLSSHNKTMFSIAETEKYAHVTYFFRGENEKAVKHETRIIIPSLRVKDYKNNPEMSAYDITNTVLQSLHNDPQDFYLINYANADMVGHSGDFNATVHALECLDTQLQLLYEKIVMQMNGTLYITADHGKAEDMYDESYNQPRTSHTNNPVPFIMINKEQINVSKKLPLTQLADIAPFILKNMGLPIPKEMIQK